MRPPYQQFGEDITNQANNEEPDPRMISMLICTKLAGRAVTRVVGRCDDAKENRNLENTEMFASRVNLNLLKIDDGNERRSREVVVKSHTRYKSVMLLGHAVLLRCKKTATEMANQVTRVIHRCEDAQETLHLDLSNCQLMQVPDAVYHLMRHTELQTCDLSDNVITKIPPKFAAKFSLITDLNLAHNQMAKLPDEMAEMGNLQRLDISYNTFIALPNAIFKIPKLEQLSASNNHIVDVEIEVLEEAPSLQKVDLSTNPLTARCHERLSGITKIQITLSPREKEDWEDLTI